MVTAIIVAAGKSERMGTGVDKAFLSLGSKPIIAWTLLAFERCPDVDKIVLVVRRDQQIAAKAVMRMFGISKSHKIVVGGARRQDSVMNGLKEIPDDTRIVVIHDGARPCVKSEVISDVVRQARRLGAVVSGCRVVDTIKYVEKGNNVTRTEDRTKLWAVQTPQAFSLDLIKKAYAAVVEAGNVVTDDAAAVEFIGEPVKIAESSAVNLKITTVEDLQLAAGIVKG